MPLIFALCIIIIIIISSCNKRNDINSTNVITLKHPAMAARDTFATDSAIIIAYANVGTLHNQGLDSVYNRLVAFKAQQVNIYGSFKCSKSQIFGICNQGSMDFVNGQFQLSVANYDTLFNFWSGYLLDFEENNVAYNPAYISQHGISISPALTNCITDITTIGENNNLSYADKCTAWDNYLNSKIDSFSNDAEKAGLVAGINVAKASYLYWSDPSNVSKWQYLLSDLTQARITSVNSDAAKADVAGAIGGGIRGAIGGFAATGPVGAACGGAVGALTGALVSSASSICWAQVWSWVGWN